MAAVSGKPLIPYGNVALLRRKFEEQQLQKFIEEHDWPQERDPEFAALDDDALLKRLGDERRAFSTTCVDIFNMGWNAKTLGYAMDNTNEEEEEIQEKQDATHVYLDQCHTQLGIIAKVLKALLTECRFRGFTVTMNLADNTVKSLV